MLFTLLSALFAGGKLAGESIAERNAQATINKYYKELSHMDILDGLEKQVEKHQNFYKDHLSIRGQKCGVYWQGDENKWMETNLDEIAVNKKYRESGLELEKFLIKYARELAKQYKGREMLYNHFTHEGVFKPNIYIDYKNYYIVIIHTPSFGSIYISHYVNNNCVERKEIKYKK